MPSALNLGHYYTFTLTLGGRETMTLVNFALKDQRSGMGPLTFVVRSSRDGFTTDLQLLPTHTALALNTVTSAQASRA